MKMEYILQTTGISGSTGRYDRRFRARPRPSALRPQPGLVRTGSGGVHPFDGQGPAFANAYRNYIIAVVGRYRGQAAAGTWSTRLVAEHGEGLRDCLWSQNLGQIDYMRRAFDYAREADPDVVLRSTTTIWKACRPSGHNSCG